MLQSSFMVKHLPLWTLKLLPFGGKHYLIIFLYLINRSAWMACNFNVLNQGPQFVGQDLLGDPTWQMSSTTVPYLRFTRISCGEGSGQQNRKWHPLQVFHFPKHLPVFILEQKEISSPQKVSHLLGFKWPSPPWGIGEGRGM